MRGVARERQVAAVLDDRQGLVGHAQAGGGPPGAEVAVLGGRVGRVEAADRSEPVSRHSQVVRREPTPGGWTEDALPAVDVDDQLRGVGVDVVLQRVDRAPADGVSGLRCRPGSEPVQPVAARAAVVVREREHLALRASGAGVASRRRAGALLDHELEVDPLPEPRHHRFQRCRAAVGHDDHLVALRRILEAREALEARAQLLRALVRGDDDRAGRRAFAHPYVGSPERMNHCRWSSITSSSRRESPFPSA